MPGIGNAQEMIALVVTNNIWVDQLAWIVLGQQTSQVVSACGTQATHVGHANSLNLI